MTDPVSQIMPAPSTMLMGPPGTGKTRSLLTYIEYGIELFVLITDPGGEESLLDGLDKLNLPMSMLHWHYIPPAQNSWDSMKEMATVIMRSSYESLSTLKVGIDKRSHTQFLDMLNCLSCFIDQNGVEYGAVDDWDCTRALAVDSLSGINIMSLEMMIGKKPTAHQGEWGVAMNAEEKLILKLTATLNCYFCLTAHVERELNEAAGHTQIMAGALGKKLAPKLPRTFSDVALTFREGAEFFWSTTAPNVDLKARTLPLSDKLPPSFGQVVDSYKARVATATKLTQPTTQPNPTVKDSTP